MNTMITIDWDYFVPEKAEYDFGHIENDFFMNELWAMRASTYRQNLLKEIVITKEVNGFWQYLRTKFNFDSTVRLIVTESHLDAYYICQENGINQVYNYDSHCDLGYKGYSQLANDVNMNCGNWLGLAALDNLVDKVNIIYSPHTLENKKNFKDIVRNLNLVYLKKDFKIKVKEDVSIIHICRSGSWTPPWLDDDFQKFVDSSGLLPTKNNVIKREWDNDDIIQQQKDYKQFLNGFKKEEEK